MRDTKYARELREPAVKKWPGGSEGRIERLYVKGTKKEEIRFPWWKNGKITTRPLDLPEDDLAELFAEAVAKDIFTDSFRLKLRSLL
ncbi:MAG: hypothetical protein ABR902_07565 [Candidatus Korobacteraceae bacterium]|jgi:hypothetical protein